MDALKIFFRCFQEQWTCRMHRIGNGAAICLTVVAVAFAWIVVEMERINIREIKKGMEKPSISKEKESDGFFVTNSWIFFEKRNLLFS